MYRKFITISTIKTVQAEWTFWIQQGWRMCTATIYFSSNDLEKED